eukprot:gene7533-10535_t
MFQRPALPNPALRPAVAGAHCAALRAAVRLAGPPVARLSRRRGVK